MIAHNNTASIFSLKIWPNFSLEEEHRKKIPLLQEKQIRTELGLTDTSIPFSFIYFIYST